MNNWQIFLIRICTILAVVFIPVAILFSTSIQQSNERQGMNWLYRDSAFFTLIMALIGYIIVNNFHQHQQAMHKTIEKLNEKVQQLEIKQSKDSADSAAIFQRLLEWADSVNKNGSKV